MPPEASRASETKAWLAKAKADLVSAEILLRAKDSTQLHQVLFHCQQAVEKSLKAFLVWYGVIFRWTHDIGEIGDQCSAVEKSLESLIGEVKYLNDYAWEYRYPGEDADPSLKQAKEGLKDASRVFSTIRSYLPDEVHLTPLHSKRSGKSKRKKG